MAARATADKPKERKSDRRNDGEGTYYMENRNGKKLYCWKLQAGERGNLKTLAVVKRGTSAERTTEVKKKLAEIDARGGRSRPGDDLKVSQFLRKWLDESIKPRREPSTHRNYEYHVEQWIIPAIGNLKVSAVNEQALQKVSDYVRAQRRGNVPDDQRDSADLVSDSTALGAVRVACNAFNISIRVARKDGLNLPEAPEPRDRFLEDDELDKFLREITAVDPWKWKQTDEKNYRYGRDRLLILFELNTGVRISEAVGIVIPMLNLREGTVRIQQQLKRTKDEDGKATWFLGATKNKKTRTLPLNGAALEIVREMLAIIEADKEKAGDAYDDHGLLFATSSGKPISPRNALRTLDRALVRAGVEKCTLHDLRRTYLTHLADAVGDSPADRKAVSTLAGHTSTTTTEQIYIHARRRRLAATAGSVEFKVRSHA